MKSSATRTIALAFTLLGGCAILASGLAYALSSAGPRAAQIHTNLVAAGEASLSLRRDNASTKVRYAVQRLPKEHQEHILIESADGEVYYRQAHSTGQQRVISMHPRSIGGVGEMLVIEYGYGAGSLRTQILRLDPEHGVAVAFDAISRFGVRIADVNGDGVDDVCLGRGDLYADNHRMLVHTWDGAAFTLSEEIPVEHVHRFAIR